MVDDAAVEARTPKDLHILAYLIYRHDTELERVELAELFWSRGKKDKPVGESDHLRLLSRTLAELGAGLGAERWRIAKPTPQTLRFETANTAIDIKELDDAICTGTPDELLRVAPLYHRGPFLEGWNDEWVVTARTQIEQRYLDALGRAAEHASKLHDLTVAQRCLEMAMEINPWRQTTWRQWMKLLATARRFRQLRALYDDFRARCIAQRQSIEMETEERYFELLAQAEQFARSPESGWLPEAPDEFINREPEVGELAQLLRSRRLLTLTGPGGIGKSRLAIEVARQVEEEFYDRAWFIDLAGETNAPSVWQKIAATLSISEAGPDLERTVIEHLRGKELLLILDNCEHLVQDCGELCDRLVRFCKSIKILATSRQRLGVAGEEVWDVPALAMPDPERRKTTQEIEAFAAIRLFVVRASTVQHPYTLDNENVAGVVEMCRYLGGLPLAIELAAARVSRSGWCIQDLVARLPYSLKILTLGPDTAPERHRKLRAAIDWSYSLLNTAEQRVFMRLCLFTGGCTEEAAYRICADGDLTPEAFGDVLLSLKEKSLIGRTAVSGETRYQLLEPLREYGLEVLANTAGETSEIARLHSRHCEYYLQLAQQAEPHLTGPQSLSWFQRLEQEDGNYQAALIWAQHNDATTGLRLAGSLWRYWYSRGRHTKGHFWLSQLLVTGQDAPLAVRLKALYGAGNIALLRTDYAQARAHYEQGLEAAKTLNEPAAIAGGLASLANAISNQGDYAYAASLYEESLTYFRQTGNHYNEAKVLTNMGKMACDRGDYERARTLHEESLALYRQLDALPSLLLALGNLAGTLLFIPDLAAARPLLRESLELCRGTPDKNDFIYILINHIVLMTKEGDDARAALLYGAEETLRTELQHELPPQGLAEFQKDVAGVIARLGAAEFDLLVQQGQAMQQNEVFDFLQQWHASL
jgi:non-specific serine/threonine protein kinase